MPKLQPGILRVPPLSIQYATAHLLALLELVSGQVDAVLLARAEQLGLEAVNLLVELLDVRRLADLLVHLQQELQKVSIKNLRL